MAYSYEVIKNILSYAVALSPDSAFPLDARSYFGSYAEALAAAQKAKEAGSTESVYFYGQQLYVVENDIVTTYLIQTDNTLKEVGSATLGDDKTITLGSDGVLSLKSFGKEYYSYIAADVVIDGEFSTVEDLPSAKNVGDYALVGDTYYKYNGTTWESMEDGFTPNTKAKHVLTDGWKAGLEPKVVSSVSGDGYELAWYEPSSTTVEGVNSIISEVQVSIDNLNQVVTNNKQEADADIAAEAAAREAADNALSSRVGNTESSITVLKGNAETEGSVLNTINSVLVQLVGDGTQETIDSLTELVQWANAHDTKVVEMNNSIQQNKTDISTLENLLGELPEGVTATTIVAYIAEVVNKETTRATAAEENLAGRLDTVESATTGLGTAAYESADSFATSAQGAKADTAIQSVVSSDNGYIAVDSKKVKAYELPAATVTTLGGVIPDSSSIAVDGNGKISVNAVDVAKVTGLDTKLTTVQENAVTTANSYTDENAVAKSSIAGSANIAENIEAASDEKVVSEKALLDMLTWKTVM